MTREDAIKRLKLWLICSEEYTEDDVSMNEAIRIAINSLEQEPCEDAVSRKAINNLRKYNLVGGISTISLKDINKLPSVNPQEPKTDVLDKIRTEIERQEKWLLLAGYTSYNADIAFDAIKSVLAESEE